MPRTPAERVDISFTLRLPPEDMKFLEARRKELEANANAEALNCWPCATRTSQKNLCRGLQRRRSRQDGSC